MREAVYKNRKIRALSYQLEGGGWIAHVEILTNGAVRGHSVNGSREYPTQEAADTAAIGMGQSWTDSHIPRRPPRRQNSGFNLHQKLGSKSSKRPPSGNGKPVASNGHGSEAKLQANGSQGNGKQGG
jgi:hypothetical protein